MLCQTSRSKTRYNCKAYIYELYTAKEIINVNHISINPICQNKKSILIKYGTRSIYIRSSSQIELTYSHLSKYAWRKLNHHALGIGQINLYGGTDFYKHQHNKKIKNEIKSQYDAWRISWRQYKRREISRLFLIVLATHGNSRKTENYDKYRAPY